MKHGFLFGTAALCGSLLLFLAQPQLLSACWSALSTVGQAVSNFNQEKNVRIAGLGLLGEGEVRKLLPLDESVWWWMSHPSAIESRLVQHQLIASARVRPCKRLGLGAWGCFNVELEERRPSMLAQLDRQRWLVGQDGGLIAPVREGQNSEEALASMERRFGRLRRISGLDSSRLSPDYLAAKLRYTREALDVIESGSGRQVDRAQLRAGGELAVQFTGLPMVATFEYDGAERQTLADRAQRLGAVLKAFEGREQAIKKVDLAFSKQAVVNLF